uniref:Uncharacterized protein n=1 Tax=Tetraselmis sp. GSL018 TaxID=582737 RepID=A0A061RP08_9CHLO
MTLRYANSGHLSRVQFKAKDKITKEVGQVRKQCKR